MIITDEKLLRLKCEDVVPDEIGTLIETLENELKHSAELGLPGIGLAAPQIGIVKNCAIIRCGGLSVNLINPKIEAGYDLNFFSGEGCLSFPGRYERTKRFAEIVVQNQFEKPLRFITTGVFAVCIQHEIDHLNGILLPDLAIKTK